GEPGGAVVELAFAHIVGSCHLFFTSPTAIAATAVHRYAVLFENALQCLGGLIGEDPTGVLATFPTGMPLAGISGLGFGIPPSPPPTEVSRGGAAVASAGGETLVAWPAVIALSPNSPYIFVMEGLWVDPAGIGIPFDLGTARAGDIGNSPRTFTTVAAGATTFLVAWADRVTDEAAVPPALA